MHYRDCRDLLLLYLICRYLIQALAFWTMVENEHAMSFTSINWHTQLLHVVLVLIVALTADLYRKNDNKKISFKLHFHILQTE